MLSSDYDLETAKHMHKSRRYVYVIFMCHMAIEKVLKAIAAEKFRKTPPKTHNLLYLLIQIDVNIPQDIFEFILKINNVGVVTRYPEDFNKLLESYPKKISNHYLKQTKEAISWLKQNERLIQ